MKSILKNSLLIFSACLVFSACSKDKKSEEQCNEKLQTQANELMRLIQNFTTNSSRSSCNTLKSKSIQLLKDAEKCDNFSKGSYQDALKSWETIDCSVF